MLCVCTEQPSTFVPTLDVSWLVLFENLEADGVRLIAPTDNWLKLKRTAAIKALTVAASKAFQVREPTR